MIKNLCHKKDKNYQTIKEIDIQLEYNKKKF